MQMLVFRLYAPLSSWGDITLGENHPSGDHPSRSALLGLLAAALGIDRYDKAQQQALANNCRFAVKQFDPGVGFADYHTVQGPDSAGKARYRTRRDELIRGAERLKTNLSSREYRADALAWVAVKLVDSHWSLRALQAALLAPKYHLYLGRKSCPPAAPLEPKLIEAECYQQAFASYQCLPLNHLVLRAKQPVFYWEGEKQEFSSDIAAEEIQSYERHSQPLSRVRWQFTTQLEHCFRPEEG